MRILLFLALAFSLAGCTIGGLASTPPPQIPSLSSTIMDEQGVATAALTVETAAIMASALSTTPFLVPGSDRAKAVIDALGTARKFVKAAQAAREVGNLTDYGSSLEKVKEAMKRINDLIGGK